MAGIGGKRTFVSERGYDGAAISCVAAHHMIGGNNPTERIVFKNYISWTPHDSNGIARCPRAKCKADTAALKSALDNSQDRYGCLVVILSVPLGYLLQQNLEHEFIGVDGFWQGRKNVMVQCFSANAGESWRGSQGEAQCRALDDCRSGASGHGRGLINASHVCNWANAEWPELIGSCPLL